MTAQSLRSGQSHLPDRAPRFAAAVKAVGQRLLRLALAGLLAWPLAAASEVEPGPGVFLIADRQLMDPNFVHTVVLLIEHNDFGSLGMIVNRRSDLKLGDAIDELATLDKQGHRLYQGGPVSPSAINYIARQAPPGAFIEVAPSVYLGGTRSGLRSLVEADIAAADLRVFGGYAGWAAGQLAAELQSGSWHLLPASAEQVFSTEPETLWKKLIGQVDPKGILTHLSPALAIAR